MTLANWQFLIGTIALAAIVLLIGYLTGTHDAMTIKRGNLTLVYLCIEHPPERQGMSAFGQKQTFGRVNKYVGKILLKHVFFLRFRFRPKPHPHYDAVKEKKNCRRDQDNE